MSTLKQLSISHLRGSVIPFVLPFEKGKKLTVIYGENGTGKSTICDAFEFLGNGNVGSLENRGLGKTNRFWPSLGKKPSDISVCLESAGSTCQAMIGKSEVVVRPAESRPHVEVLRKTKILSLIQATPGGRYEAIRKFIDVSATENAEAALQQLINELHRGRDIAIARVQENEDELRRSWETAGKPKADLFAWAKEEANKKIDTYDTEISALNSLQIAYNRLTDYPEKLKTADQVLKDAQAANSAAKKSVEDCVRNVSQDAEETIAILVAAQGYLLKHPAPSVCPLCESSEKIADLANRVSQRIKPFSSLQTAQSQTRTTEQGVQRALQSIQNLLESAKQHAIDFEDQRKKYTWPNDVALPTSPAPEDASSLAEWLVASAHLPKAWKDAEATRYDKKQFVGNLKKALKNWQDNTEAQKNIDRLLPRLQKALEILQEERRNFTDDILSNISKEVGRLYEVVHPSEGLEKISLQLDPNKRASLEIGANFCGCDTPPQAYYSDSHLDTLGLCIYLALATMDQPENTILVLDDVLASIDEPHVDRLIEMLYSEVVRFRHCLITTHYGPWKHKLRWGWLQNGQCQFVELAKWTNHSGLSTIRSVPDIESLKDLLAKTSPDPQLVCAKAGFILEAALNFLTLLYECPVPRKSEDRYTLGDLLPAIDKKLRQALTIDVLTGRDKDDKPIYKSVSLTPMIEELTRIAQARNVFGCHFKTLSFELLDNDALIFGRQVLEFMDVLTDSDAGWPKNDKSGKYWATSGETRRLSPLKRPS